MISENEEKAQFSSKEVFYGEIRCIISPDGKTPYGFICNHDYHEEGFNKDIFFSFRSIETQEKLAKDNHISFKVAKNTTSGMIWATNVRKAIQQGGEIYE